MRALLLFCALLLFVLLSLSGCVGTLVKDLSKDQATLRVRITSPVYGVLELDRTNVQGGSANSTREGLIVDTTGKIPPVK